MRIGILCHASFGGSARVATELAIGLAKRNHQVHLFTRTLPFGQWNENNGVRVHTVVPEWENTNHPARLITKWSESELNTFLVRVLNVAINERLDVIHFHYAVPFAQTTLKVRRQLEPVAPVIVGTLHGTDVSIHGRSPEVGTRLSRILLQMDALTTVSQNYAQLSSEVFQLPLPPRVIPNFVDLSRFRPQGIGQSSYQRKQSRIPRLVHISNFRPVKDPQSMARIFVGIRKQINAELWLIGDGPEMDSVKAIFRENGVEKNVKYWGLQKDVAPLLTQSDLLLQTSLSESFSLVALEAMACGVPVLSTNVGGLPEVVLDGRTGMLFQQSENGTAVRMALEILTNPSRHQQMREAALRRARQFDQQYIIPLYESLYRELLQCRASINLMPFRQKQVPITGARPLSVV